MLGDKKWQRGREAVDFMREGWFFLTRESGKTAV